jgi:hypothetical protein
LHGARLGFVPLAARLDIDLLGAKLGRSWLVAKTERVHRVALWSVQSAAKYDLDPVQLVSPMVALRADNCGRGIYSAARNVDRPYTDCRTVCRFEQCVIFLPSIVVLCVTPTARHRDVGGGAGVKTPPGGGSAWCRREGLV